MNRLNYKIASLLLAAQVAAFADVSYVEEVVNSGVGSKKRGARRTILQVHIKGALQRVSTDIETSKEMTRVLQYQGATLQGTKILLLDQNRLYDINRSTGTYRQQTLPATKRVAPASAGKPAASAASADRVFLQVLPGVFFAGTFRNPFRTAFRCVSWTTFGFFCAPLETQFNRGKKMPNA